jgi:hypothetical protein
MVRSDGMYFLCLGLSLFAAVGYPWLAWQGVSRRNAVLSVTAAIVGPLGFLCTLPFGRTLEMPWYPWLAGIYFAAVTLSILFIALGRLFPEEGQPRGFEPVVRSIDELRR